MKRFLLPGVVALIAGLALALLLNSGGNLAPDVTVKTIKGETIQLSSLRGKVVVINFWATSCATCVQEMPELSALYRQYQTHGLELVAIAMQYDPPNYVMNYAESKQLPFKVALDVDGAAAQAFGGILGTPTTYVIDPQGKVFKRYLGIPNWSELRQWLNTTLEKP